MKSWRFVTRVLTSLYLVWQMFVVVKKLGNRSSFVRTSRPSSKRVDLVLKVDGRPTQGVISVIRAHQAVEIHLRPNGLVELAEVDRALVPNDPDGSGSWPHWVLPPVAEPGIISADTLSSELLPLSDFLADGDDGLDQAS